MQTSVNERAHTQGAPKALQRRCGCEHTQRRNGKHQTQATQSPVARAAGQGLGGVGPQEIIESSVDQPGGGQRQQQHHKGLGPRRHKMCAPVHTDLQWH